jgi:hypothetical protein
MTSASRPSTITGVPEGTGPYNLSRPTLDDARSALQRIFGSGADDQLRALLFRAGPTGHESDPAFFDRLVEAMTAAADPLTRLCARSLKIRASAHTHLSAAQAAIAVPGKHATPTNPAVPNNLAGPLHAEECS